MQLDKTRIAIRQRDWLDLLDLALRVTRQHVGGLLGLWLLGVLPWVLVDVGLLSAVGVRLGQGDERTSQYYTLSFMLLVWQIPLATAPLTIYLSRAMFTEPRLGEVWRALAERGAQWLWYQGVVRGLFPLVIVAVLASRADATWIGFFSFAAALHWGVSVLYYPFLNEVLLLERNPWQRRPGGITTLARAMSIQRHMRGDIFVRGVLALFLAGLLFMSLLWSLLGTWSFLNLRQETTPVEQLIATLLAAWLVVGFFTVVRFLQYLDLRIGAEGWEVELVMRAEGARLSRPSS